MTQAALPAALFACALALGCDVRASRVSGEGVPCSASSQCEGGATCFLSACRGGSAALATVFAEVQPPPGAGYSVTQFGPIDLRQSVLVNLRLAPSLSVGGEVLQLLGGAPAAGSSPVSGASVTFTSRSQLIPDRVQQATVQATNGGLFSTKLPPGTWDAAVVPPAPLPPLAAMLGLTGSTSSLQLLLPASGALLRVQGQLSAGPSALAGARVLAVDASGTLLAAAATTDATGAFQLILPPDTTDFYLRAGPDQAASSGAQATLLPSYAPVGPFAAGSAPVAYDFGAAPPSAPLSGTVLDSTGDPVVGAHVYAISLDGAGYTLSASTVSDANGAFQLALLAGEFAVEAAPAAGASAPGLSAEADVEVPAQGLSLSLVCPPRVQAQGTLLQADGTPAPAGTEVTATRLPDRLVTGRVAQTSPSDASGHFTLLADAGSYRVSIVPPATSGLASTTALLDVESGAPLTPIQLAPPLQVVGTLTGAVSSGGDAPIAGATLQFFALDASGTQSISLGTGLTDASGAFLAVLPDTQQPVPPGL